MSNHGDDWYEEGSYYVEEEPAEEYVPEYVQNPHTMPGSRPPFLATNTELLETLHRMGQSLEGISRDVSEFRGRLNTVESRMDERGYPRASASRARGSRGRAGGSRFRGVIPRRLEYGSNTPAVEAPHENRSTQQATPEKDGTLIRAEGSGKGQGRAPASGGSQDRSLAERLEITRDNLALIVQMAHEEAGTKNPTTGGRAPNVERRNGRGRIRGYRGVRGRNSGGRGLIPTYLERQRSRPDVEILASHSASSRPARTQVRNGAPQPPRGSQVPAVAEHVPPVVPQQRGATAQPHPPVVTQGQTPHEEIAPR